MSRPAHREALLLITGASSREAVSAVFRETWSVPPSGGYSSRNADWESRNDSSLAGDRFAAGREAVPVSLQGLVVESQSVGESSSSDCSSRESFGGAEGQSVNDSSRALVLVGSDASSPLVSAMIAASKIPEARELLAIMAGNAAREGARGVVHSIPEVLSRMLWRRREDCRMSSRSAGGVMSVQHVQVAVTVLMSVLLYTSTSVPVL